MAGSGVRQAAGIFLAVFYWSESVHWKKVSILLFCGCPDCRLIQNRSFAVMEILKTLVVVLKLFQLKRVGKEETVVREGFFTKAAECKVVITRRD